MNWENEARRILRAELVRRGLTYAMLAKRLQGLGIAETERAIANKLSRGTFAFTFFLQCMAAMEVERVVFDLTPASNGSRPEPPPRQSS